ncbi:hypothetical protein HYDPIDRAFT_26068 [Hydnomerulius pinastri MD-312]|nr:hypothetical protein HYDPIDRAFT_26068 [Hydnomerulius pinastri MD-312]
MKRGRPRRSPDDDWDTQPRVPASSKRRLEQVMEVSMDVDAGPSADAAETKRVKTTRRPIYDVMKEYDEYVNNRIPAHMIYLPEKRLIGRKDILELFRQQVEMITELDINDGRSSQKESWGPARKLRIETLIKPIVKYAIFSHTWLSSGEPSFQQIRQRDMTPGPGLDKLLSFCREAERRSFVLAWSDTCCIDQTNHAELSEAIRAMFLWYQNAHICIAHLPNSTTTDDFKDDRWFTRGWTLQELLAPENVKFFGKDWQPLSSNENDKADPALRKALSRVTGIPSGDLKSFRRPWKEVDRVRDVLSWASKRQTTRLEDVAYCLTGLLNVHLTVQYGEGEEAFERLMLAISNVCSGWQLLCWAGRASPRYSAFPISPAAFIPCKIDSGDRRSGVGSYSMSNRTLRMKLPLVPMKAHRNHAGDDVCTLELTPSESGPLWLNFDNVVIKCGASRFHHLKDMQNLFVGILDFKRQIQSGSLGRPYLTTGEEYFCILLYPNGESQEDGLVWTKVFTDNLLRIRCVDRAAGEKQRSGSSDLAITALETVYIE